MKADEISTPNVPIVYVLLTLEQAEERGVARDELLKGTSISSALLERPDARIPLLEYGRIVAPGPNAVDERTIYNTNAYSKGNQGHAYTKVLTDAERRALIEYLKTL